MERTVLFLDMFPRCALDEVWAQVQINEAQIDPQERRISISIFSPNYLSNKQIKAAQTEVKEHYDVHSFTVCPNYPMEAISQIETRDLVDELYLLDSTVRPVLAGIKWEVSAGKIIICLAANGKDKLEPLLPALKSHLQKLFQVAPEIEIRANHTETEELFEETEKIRLEAVKHLPTPSFVEKQAQANVQQK